MSFIFSFPLFIILCLLTFTIPGVFLLSFSKHKFEGWEEIFLGSTIGFVVFTLLSYFLIVINLTILIIPIVAIVNILGFRKALNSFRSLKFSPRRQIFIIPAVFVIGIIGQVAVIAPSGININGDILFWSAHGHDGAWHIALMEEIKRGWPFENPVFAGNRLVNYHFFSDITPAIFSKYFSFANLDLYFRFFPLIFSLFLGTSAYFFTKKITNSFSASIWAVIFTYFAGSFGYLIGRGESVFWATQPQSSSGNPPQIISNFMFLSFLYFVYLLIKKHDRIIFIAAVLFLGTLTVFKVYAAIILFGALGIVGIWQLIKEGKIHLLALGAASVILSAILYLPNSSGALGFLILEPWWYIRTMIVEPSRLNLIDWELRRQTYIYEHNWKRVIYLEGLGFLIFFFGNLGMRFIGLLDFLRAKLIFTLAIIISLVLPLLFLQRGVASNTSQFLQYFVLLFGILAGISTAKILNFVRSRILKITIALIIIAFSIPTQVGLLREFYSRPAFAKISSSELEALYFIKKNTKQDAVILTPPYDQYLNLGGPIPNIWDWFDTAYVSAFSSRRTYMDDYEQVDIMGYDYRTRLEIKKTIFTEVDAEVVKQKLLATGGNYLYFPKPVAPKVNLKAIGLIKVFENYEVEIWNIPF